MLTAELLQQAVMVAGHSRHPWWRRQHDAGYNDGENDSYGGDDEDGNEDGGGGSVDDDNDSCSVTSVMRRKKRGIIQ